jgi:hypothetical protein
MRGGRLLPQEDQAMIQRSLRLLALLVLVAVLGGGSPLAVAAQFPSQQQDETPGQGQGGFYQGQAYEFSLTWGPEWTLVNEVSGEEYELINLTNGVSTVQLGGITRQDTPQNVVLQIAELVGDGQLTFIEVEDDEPNVASAYFSDASRQVVVSIFVAVTGPSPGHLIIWEYPFAQQEAELVAYNALIDGLEVQVIT